MCDVDVQRAFVEPLALAERERIERVVVVREDHDPGVDVAAVDRHAEAARTAQEQGEGLQTRERIAALAPVDEPRVQAK